MTKISPIAPISLLDICVSQRCLYVKPRRGGGNRYRSTGLICRMVKPGIYRIRRSDGRDLNVVNIQIQHAEPWRDQKVPGFVRSCRTHGFECPGEEDCNVSLLSTMVKKWSVFVRTRDAKCFEVVILKNPAIRDPRRRAAAEPSGGTGFYVMLTSRARD